MPTYDRAPASVSALIAQRIASGHYPDLAEAEVTVSAWFAYSKDDDGTPALKLHGYPCAATIKINSCKDRLQGKADASMDIDGRAWQREWSDEEKVAIIEHELAHLLVCRAKITKKNKLAYILSDNIGRPKLKMRLHDMILGGFSEIAKRHGPAALEVQMARQIKNDFGQLLFAWDDDNAPGDDIPEIRLSGKTVEADDIDDEDEDAA
jgi:hypothetical protein